MIYSMIKRLFDIIFSALGIIILIPVFFIIFVIIKMNSPGPVIFKQKRMGMNWNDFDIYKFRTMMHNADSAGPSITMSNDKRITSVGRKLRKYKLDELPQLFNVLKGDMSFVGPRPEVPEYTKMYVAEYNEILKIKPGITDMVTLLFRDEERALHGENPEELYREVILPIKVQFLYIHNKKRNLFSDFIILFHTLIILFTPDDKLPAAREKLIRKTMHN